MYTVINFDLSLKYCVYSHALTMDVYGARRNSVYNKKCATYMDFAIQSCYLSV